MVGDVASSIFLLRKPSLARYLLVEHHHIADNYFGLSNAIQSGNIGCYYCGAEDSLQARGQFGVLQLRTRPVS